MTEIRAEILVNASPKEARVAIIENGVVQYISIERPDAKGIVGNIYKGRVVRVLPGMQAAFVDIGLERAGFLHVSDIMPFREDEQEVDLSSPEADIRKWVKEGQEMLVQVLKDPLGTKGARLTRHLSIASRYLVYMPDLKHVGISLRLENEEERERLMALFNDLLGEDDSGGYILRTAAEGVKTESLQRDMEFLHRTWAVLQKTAKKTKCPAAVYEDLPLIKKVVRDMVTVEVEAVRVDSLEVFHELRDFAKQFVPNVFDRLSLYQGDTSIFEMHSVEDELKKALKRHVSLKSGGYLVIDQTEAMTTIDINTGAFTGSRNLEETIYKTNLEAAQAISRQLRLRNLGGIIIIDFIDMADEEHKEQLLNTFKKSVERDVAKTNVSEVSSLGLIQMTRKRTQESLSQHLCEMCTYCQGRAYVKTLETMAYEIYRELHRESKIYRDAEGFMIIAPSDVIDYLKDEETHSIAELEEQFEKPIRFQPEPTFTREQFDIVLM